MVYSDLNGNGIIETPSEILDEVHYYPNGLKMEGYWMNSDKFRYTFNGIEEVNDFGLGVNMATFRTLDPELGRWWSVDPRAAGLMHLNPYNSMANSPLVYNDPNGDWIHVAIGAVIGGAVNVATHWNQINGIGDGLKAFGIGAAGGALTAATGAGVVGAGAAKGFLIGAGSGMAGDAFTQVGNGIAFNDQYNGKQTLYAGALGGVIGGITGGLTYSPPAQTTKEIGEEVFEEFIDTYANTSVGGGGNIIKDATAKVADDIGFSVKLSDDIVVSATRSGSFSVSNWTGYPSWLTRPQGPFRLIEGRVYREALKLKNSTNTALRKKWDLVGKPYDIHEIHPVKFGGSPTDLANKIIVPRNIHNSQITPFWNRVMNSINRR